MRTMMVMVALLIGSVHAQEPAKPGPEHELLKDLVGTWDVTMKMEGKESKGVSVYKMDLGGFWLTSQFDCDMFGTKFTGKGLDGYDQGKKKYTSVWADSMSSGMVVMEGTYDKEKKTLNMAGEGPGMDGKPTKYRSVTKITDKDTHEFAMWIGETKEPTFSITYKRKK